MLCLFRNIRAFQIQGVDRAKDLLWLTHQTLNYNAFLSCLELIHFYITKPLCMTDIQYQNNKIMEKHFFFLFQISLMLLQKNETKLKELLSRSQENLLSCKGVKQIQDKKPISPYT